MTEKIKQNFVKVYEIDKSTYGLCEDGTVWQLVEVKNDVKCANMGDVSGEKYNKNHEWKKVSGK